MFPSSGAVPFQDANCPLCSLSHEHCFHLQGQCHFSVPIWNSIGLKLKSTARNLESIESMARSLLSCCDQSKEGNIILAKSCFPAFSWNIWQGRNIRFFQNKKSSWESILRRIMLQVRARAMFLNLDISAELVASWDLPPKSMASYSIPTHHCSSWNLLKHGESNHYIDILRNIDHSVLWKT